MTFTATPSGYTTPSYQWYKNEIAISGETGSTYTTTSLTNYDLIYVTAKDLNPPSGGSITTNGLIVQLDASDPRLIPLAQPGQIKKEMRMAQLMVE